MLPKPIINNKSEIPRSNQSGLSSSWWTCSSSILVIVVPGSIESAMF